MKAVVYKQALPIEHPQALIDTDLPQPTPGIHDLLVKVQSISVNPVDTKIRQGVVPEGARVLGWDAVGEIVEVGPEVRDFQPGQIVWYAGELDRPGSNSEFQCVDYRLAALAPQTISSIHAAALPLTSLTAWELLFERLNIPQGKSPKKNVLLVSGAAGGVGSILIQLARKLSSATIIATAGRPESEAWAKEMGAHHVVDYRQELQPQLGALGFSEVTHVASLTHSDRYFESFVELLAPFGHLALIDDPGELKMSVMKSKSLSLHWEFMFTRSMYQTPDMSRQGQILTQIAQLVDQGSIQSTFSENLGLINAENLSKAHQRLEKGISRGKLVLSGF